MTREEAIKNIEEHCYFANLIPLAKEALDMAIKALGQESVLNKIKEEIKDNTYFINETTEKEGIDFETVEKIIDKYRKER